MNPRVAFAVFCTGTLVWASSVGTRPRSAAAQYSAHATNRKSFYRCGEIEPAADTQDLYFRLEPLLRSLGSGYFP